MKYNKQLGNPHTFKIPDDLWISLKKTAKKNKEHIQDTITKAISERLEKILKENCDIVKLDQSKNRTIRILNEIWDPFKNICSTKKLHLHRQFLMALHEYLEENNGL